MKKRFLMLIIVFVLCASVATLGRPHHEKLWFSYYGDRIEFVRIDDCFYIFMNVYETLFEGCI